MKLKQFEIVMSTAGRDIGNIYIVKEIVDENYVNLIDGKAKTLTKPKLKKQKHLVSLNSVEEQLHEVFNDKSKINDGVIRKILKNYEKFE